MLVERGTSVSLKVKVAVGGRAKGRLETDCSICYRILFLGLEVMSIKEKFYFYCASDFNFIENRESDKSIERTSIFPGILFF